MRKLLKNINDTRQFAAEFVQTLKGGEVVILSGDLGAGKTTFVQAVAQILRANTPVNSPTFTLLQHYSTKNKIIKIIHHLDLYRIASESELPVLGLEELLGQPHTVSFIEWGEKYANFFERYTPMRLHFHHGQNADERVVEIEKHP